MFIQSDFNNQSSTCTLTPAMSAWTGVIALLILVFGLANHAQANANDTKMSASLENTAGPLGLRVNIVHGSNGLKIDGDHFTIGMIARTETTNTSKKHKIRRIWFKVNGVESSKKDYSIRGNAQRSVTINGIILPKSSFRQTFRRAAARCRENIAANPNETSLISDTAVLEFYSFGQHDNPVQGPIIRLWNQKSVTQSFSLTFACPASKNPKPFGIATTLESEGTTCPRKVKVISDAFFLKPGGVAKFRVLHNGGNAKTRKIAADYKVPNTVYYRARYVREITVPAGNNTFETRVKGAPKNVVKKLHIACRSFNIGFTDLRYKMNDNGKCPRKVRETVTFYANGPGKFTYQIKHIGGLIMHEEEIEAKLVSGTYKAISNRYIFLTAYEGQHIAQIKTNTGINSGWKKVEVVCKPKPSGSAADVGLTAPTPTTHGKKPANKIANTPPKKERPTVCKGGKLKRGKCVCASRFKRKKIGVRKYKCVAKPAIVKTAPVLKKPKKAKLTCVRGKKRSNRCICPSRTKLVKINKRKFKCVKVKQPKAKKAKAKKRKAKSRKCKKGKVLLRGRCVRPAR